MDRLVVQGTLVRSSSRPPGTRIIEYLLDPGAPEPIVEERIEHGLHVLVARVTALSAIAWLAQRAAQRAAGTSGPDHEVWRALGEQEAAQRAIRSGPVDAQPEGGVRHLAQVSGGEPQSSDAS